MAEIVCSHVLLVHKKSHSKNLFMAAEQTLATQVRQLLTGTANVEEKKMFHGLAFMINDKLCLSVKDDNLLVRIDPALTETVLKVAGCKQMVHNNRIMKGYFFVSAEALHNKKELSYWVQLALDYNKVAKSSKKKKAESS
jgi:TfoX/Sxy family transcriptional regulator of competence genes